MHDKAVSHCLWTKDIESSGWKPILRPGSFADKRDEIFKRYDATYGADNWGIGWIWNGEIIPYDKVCKLYEDAYLADSFKRKEIWEELRSIAYDVYDDNESNVASGRDYTIQETDSTHIQDIAVRNVFFRRGWDFEGDKLVQIRSSSSDVGRHLSPGKVPFHKPEYLVGYIDGWWDKGSVEAMYQVHKVLVVGPEVDLEILNDSNSIEYRNYIQLSDLVKRSRVL